MPRTAQTTSAATELRAMLPDGADPDATIEFACRVAFLVREDLVADELGTAVAAYPQQATALIVTLAAMVDVDQRPGDLLAWLGSWQNLKEEAARTLGAVAEARAGAGDTLPPVTLESMREMIHAARLAKVLPPCGTPDAWSRHHSNGQKPCIRCRRARKLYDRATPEQRKLLTTPLGKTATRRRSTDKKPPTAHPSCGTQYGYQRHWRDGEDFCRPCRQAHSESNKAHYDRKLASQGRVRVGRGRRQPAAAGKPSCRKVA